MPGSYSTMTANELPWFPAGRSGGRVEHQRQSQPRSKLLAPITRYGDPYGYLPLRLQIAGVLLPDVGIASVDARQVLLTTGASRALDLIVRRLLEPGDAVLVDDPGYYNLQHIGSRHVPMESFRGYPGFIAPRRACPGAQSVAGAGNRVPAESSSRRLGCDSMSPFATTRRCIPCYSGSFAKSDRISHEYQSPFRALKIFRPARPVSGHPSRSRARRAAPCA